MSPSLALLTNQGAKHFKFIICISSGKRGELQKQSSNFVDCTALTGKDDAKLKPSLRRDSSKSSTETNSKGMKGVVSKFALASPVLLAAFSSKPK